MKKNQKELMDLMYEHRMIAADVAALLYCTPNNVRVWRCNGGNAMPDAKLELLRFKLEAKKNVE